MSDFILSRLVLFLFFIFSLQAESSYWNEGLVKPYVHNSELQRRWAMAFMASHLKQLIGNEAILDIGCGDGKITADISRFVPEGAVTGVDLSKDMISWAKKQYHRLEYPNLNFYEGSFHDPAIEGKTYDVIVSFCALQHSFDQKKSVLTLAKLLNPGGKLLILIPTRNNVEWNRSRAIVQAYERWAPFWKGVPSRPTLPVEEYRSFLLNAGLKGSVDMHATKDPFVDREEIISWLKGTFAPVVPNDKADEFFNDWMNQYLRDYPQANGEDGVIFAELGYITIVGIKK